MKLSKRALSLTAVVTGAMLLATSAFADVLIGSGYNSLKGAVKTTAEKLTKETDSFGMDYMWTIKADGSPISSCDGSVKYDIKNNSHSENRVIKQASGIEQEHIYYSDSTENIIHDSENETYYVYKKNGEDNKDEKIIDNPFDEAEADDAEKIIDALTGSLQEVIQAEQADGKLLYTGNISNTEVPALINAFSSYFMKYSVLPERQANEFNIPYLCSGIFIENASGKAIENEDGIIETVFGNASIKGEDKNGNEHNYSLEITVNITGINNTVVERPDLTGCDVEENYYNDNKCSLDEKYIGKYVSNEIEEENNQFVKTGEKVLEITEANGETVVGKISENYKEGFAPENVKNFEFKAEKLKDNYYLTFTYNENGEEKTGLIFDNGPDLRVEFDVEMDEDNCGYSSKGADDNFVRIFE